MAFRLNGIWNNTQKTAFIDGYKYIGADVKIKTLDVDNIILNGNILGLNISQIQGIVVEQAGTQGGGGGKRSIIGNEGTFTYTNELIPSTTLISGQEYMLEWDEPNNNYKNVLKPDLRGAQGIQGIQGIQGNTGSQGIQGNTGGQGIQGNTGGQGIQGTAGRGLTTPSYNASTGILTLNFTDTLNPFSTGNIRGAQGIQGIQGNTGGQGIQGNTGSQGIQGTAGRGLTTPSYNASTGILTLNFTDTLNPFSTGNIRGAQGIQGIQGNTGGQGIQGNTGSQGIQGTAGRGLTTPSYNASTGILTLNFTDTLNPFSTGNIRGAQGIQGNTGGQGIQGNTGSQGIQGNTGSQGIQGVAGINAKNIITTSLANDNRITFNFNDSTSITTTNSLTISNDTTYTQEQIDTKDNDTSNYILELLEVIPYETLSVPLKDAPDIIPPITSVPIIDIDNDYKYIAFTNNTVDLIYNFTGLANIHWLALVDTIPNSSRTAGSWFSQNPTWPGMFIYPGDAFISIILPSGYNNISITFGNQDPSIVEGCRVDLSINGIVVSTATGGVYKTYTQSYVAGDVLRIVEFVAQIHRNMIIRIFNIETYNINFQEQTEVQLLLLDRLKYIETAPFLFSGIGNITVGTLLSSFNAITATTNFNSGFLSNITGQYITYNTPQVIIRYKYTPIITQIPNEGYLNYTLDGWEISDIVGDTNLLIQNTSNYITNTSNVISTRITNLPQPNLTPYRLVHDSYTKTEVDSRDTITSNVISTRINNLPIFPSLTGFRLISDSYTKLEVDTKDTATSNVISTRINNLPNFPSLTPYRLVNDSYTKLEVDTKDTATSNVISTRINNLPNFPSLTGFRLISDSYTKLEVDTIDINSSNILLNRINNLDALQVVSGVLLLARIPTLDAAKIPNLDANKITSGTLLLARIPTLDAAKIPNLDANKITSGTLLLARIPTLDAAKIPNLDANKITSGTLLLARIPTIPYTSLSGNPNLSVYRLISDSYTKTEVDSQDTITSNVISTRINNLPAPQNYVLPIATTGALGGVRIANGGGIFMDFDGSISTNNFFTNVEPPPVGGIQVRVVAGTQLNSPSFGKLFISTVQSAFPQIANNTMVNHLEVNGSSRINGILHIVEASGTAHNANNGSILLEHENNGGASSIVFTSRVNRSSDYGYIQYQDSSSVGAGGESARLIIGTQNDGDDHIILQPAGNVGIATNSPLTRLTVKTNYSDENTGFCLDANDGGAYNVKFFSYVVGSGAVGHKFKINNQNNIRDNVLCLSPDGFVGIGVSAPWIRLTVGGGGSSSGSLTRFFGNTQNGVGVGGSLNDTVIFASGSIHSTNWFGSSSDIRIKKDIQDLDDTEMLNKVLLLKPVKYAYLDKEKNDELVYGFIAQDVKEVMGEEGVKLMREFIYDINEYAVVNDGIITFNGVLEVGLFYKIFHKEKAEYLVIKIDEKTSDNTYTATLESGEVIENSDIFIVGKRVDDFHSLNKNAIFTMGIGAIQELHRTIQRQQTVIDSLIARLEALEAV